jgi:hypothetical protein
MFELCSQKHGCSSLRNMTKDLVKHIYILLLFFAVPTLHAQGISPIISEYGHGKVNGTFTVTNASLEPLSVVIQEHSFSVNPDGKSAIRPLDPGIHIEIDSMSVKIGVKQQHEFAYKVKCDILPCWATFNAELSGAHAANGLAMIMIVPHTFYICKDKQKGCRDRIRRDVFHLEK